MRFTDFMRHFSMLLILSFLAGCGYSPTKEDNDTTITGKVCSTDCISTCDKQKQSQTQDIEITIKRDDIPGYPGFPSYPTTFALENDVNVEITLDNKCRSFVQSNDGEFLPSDCTKEGKLKKCLRECIRKNGSRCIEQCEINTNYANSNNANNNNNNSNTVTIHPNNFCC